MAKPIAQTFEERFRQFEDMVLKSEAASAKADEQTKRLAESAAHARENLDTLAKAASVAPFPLDRALAPTGILHFPDKPTLPEIEMANKLRERYEPLGRGAVLDEKGHPTQGPLAIQKDLLDSALRHGLITPELHDRGWRDAVQELADRMGIGGETKLPGAALVGSQEDARILVQHLVGSQRSTTEQLLMQIRDLLARQGVSVRSIERAPPPRPVEVTP